MLLPFKYFNYLENIWISLTKPKNTEKFTIKPHRWDDKEALCNPMRRWERIARARARFLTYYKVFEEGNALNKS